MQLKNNEIFVMRENSVYFHKYMTEINKVEVLTKEDEFRLFSELASGDTSAADKIYKANLKFVVLVAKRYMYSLQNTAFYLEDLINEGNIGLYNAIKRFDHTRGFKFSSLAVHYIRQPMMSFLSDCGSTIRTPINQLDKINDIKKRTEKMEQHSGHEHTTDDVDPVASMTIVSCVSLTKPFSGINESTSLIDVLCDEGAKDSHSILESKEKKEQFYKIMNKLTPMEKTIITHKFGLYDNESLSFSELSEQHFGSKYSGECLRHKYQKILLKLKKLFKNYETIYS